jgi:ATP-binding cassette subfamily A (ABC1) protein 3
MGMKTFYYYFSWFIRNLVVYGVTHLICSIIIVSQFKSVPFITVFIIFILFDVLLIIQNFFIQVFLSRAKIGVVISLLFFILQYVISFISTNSDNPTLRVNIAVSIIPHCAFVLAFQNIVYAQSVQIAPSFRE